MTSAVSAKLEISALFLGISDTAGGAAYRYVCNGERVEEFVFSMEDQESQFFSTQRQVDVRRMGYDDVDAIVRDLGIIPPLFWSPLESVGSNVRPQQEIDPYWEQVKEVLILDNRKNR